MAKPELSRTSPLDGRLPWALPDGVVLLEEQRFLHQIGLRLRPGPPAYFAGLPMPLEPNRVGAMQAIRVLWLGPDEWLVTAPEDAAPELPARLARAVEDRRAVILDLSAARVAIEVSGRHARDLVQKGCGLDLHPRAFMPGQCAQTVFAKLPVIIDQFSTLPAYRLFVRRSSAPWLCRWLIDAAEEFRAADPPARHIW